MPIAKVEPLLTTRSVSGPFDYRLSEAMEDVQVGSVLVQQLREAAGLGAKAEAPA
jgi:hypothetical protein